jgi:hypothetical protein
MDRAEAALRVAEAALLEARKALKLASEVSVIQGPKGDKGDKGDAGDVGPSGVVSAEALADVWQDVWQEGKTYQRGQVAQWGGSIWLSFAENSDKPGDGSKSWKLIVKRGRDGKDGKDGLSIKGDKGPKGDKGEIGYA